MKQVFIKIPADGAKITTKYETFLIPPNPIIPYIEGDGIGEDLWKAARPVLDAAVGLAYGPTRQLCWMELPAGQKALVKTGSLLPPESVQAFADYRVGLKGPLTTPVGGGFRSINVALRRELDLYACMRPVKWIPGVPSPVKNPDLVDMVIFRENTEDLYAGIEFKAGSRINQKFLIWLEENDPEAFAKIRFTENCGFSIKPISRQGSERLVRAAIKYALENKRKKLTLIHKGNIMKHTEGAFASWGYQLAETEYREKAYTQHQFEQSKASNGQEHAESERAYALKEGKILINDVITDAAFEQTLTRPEEFDVIATMNLNGDFLSDALAAQVGGLGIAPGVNFNDEAKIAIFEATHGTAPSLAGKNCANPSSLILSGTMMLHHLGWHAAGDLVLKGIQNTIKAKTVTFDLKRLMPGSKLLSTFEFGTAIIQHMRQVCQTQ